MSFKQYFQKHWMVLSLCFLVIFISSSLFPFLDETPLEPSMPWHISLFSSIGFILSIPIIFLHRFTIGIVSSSSFKDLGFVIPFVTAIIYTWLFGFIGFKRQKA